MVEIINMSENDIDAVVAIEEQIFSRPWSRKSFLDAFAVEENVYLVAKNGDKVVGYCGIWISYEDADLCNMAVLPEYRRQNIGQRLLEKGISFIGAKQVERLHLEVRESNRPAILLYQKIGFEPVGIRKKYLVMMII